MTNQTILGGVTLPEKELMFALDELYERLQGVTDQRGRKGRQYALPALLMIGVLAKLAGHTDNYA
jgi:hypothetical protein